MSNLPFAPLTPSAPAPAPNAPQAFPAVQPPSAAPAYVAPQPAPSFPEPTPAVPTFAPAVSYSERNPAPTIEQILTTAYNQGASDIHFQADLQVRYRVDGDLVPMPQFPDPISGEWLEKLIASTLSKELLDNYEANHEADTSFEIEDLSRFRVNIFQQRTLPGSVFRVIPTEIKTAEELGLPAVIRGLTKLPKGLVLVTGPTGSGKSTTLAAMIDLINETRPDHIMTMEDPVEFVHRSKKSLVNQREIGEDTKSFAEALKRVLRQDPDVILVGELRDPETIATALTAAETGHLVFGTLHTQSASKTIDRIVDSFSPAQQGQIKAQLAGTLQAVIAQTLLKKNGGGRVPATEVMVRTDAIANNIREGNISQIYNSIQTGSSDGMHTLDQDLMRLVSIGQISKERARPLMRSPEDLDSVSVKNMSAGSDDWEN